MGLCPTDGLLVFLQECFLRVQRDCDFPVHISHTWKITNEKLKAACCLLNVITLQFFLAAVAVAVVSDPVPGPHSAALELETSS